MKHDNYDSTAGITLVKANTRKYEGMSDFFSLRYNNGGEEWELYGTKEEILEELSEHMDNMKMEGE